MSESKQANQVQNRAAKRKRQLKKPQQLQPTPASLEPRIEPVEPVVALQRATTAPRSAIRPADILTLQRAVGNQAVTRLLAARGDGQIPAGPAHRLPSQPKLSIGPAQVVSIPGQEAGIKGQETAVTIRQEAMPIKRQVQPNRTDGQSEGDHHSQRKYSSERWDGQKLIAHELTHVVLQSESAGNANANTVTQRSQEPIIQRAIGLEIESTPDWSVYDQNKELIKDQHLKLLSTDEFRLETELSGKLEFVIEPPAQTTKELVEIVQKVQKVAEDLYGAKVTYKKQRVFDTFTLELLKKLNKGMSEEEIRKKYEKEVFPNKDLIDLQRVFGKKAFGKKVPSVYISKGQDDFHGGFQATVGVHLSAIPALFELVKTGFESYPTKKEMGQAQSASGEAQARSMGLPFTWYKQMSPEMEGLLNLVYYYIFVGRSERGRRPFPKGITQIMAKTNFAQMFSMTPEAAFLARRPEFWVKFVTDAAELNPDDKIFRGTFGDTDQDETTIDVTYREWLLGMVGTAEQKGADKLSVAGGGPEILKTMGSTSNTDDLGIKDESNRGVIVELRGLDATTWPFYEWDKFAQKIGESIERLNAYNDSKKKMAANKEVAEAGKGSQLFWSFLRSEQEVGQDVFAMAIEAYKAPFEQQVHRLISGAKARAEAAFSQREAM